MEFKHYEKHCDQLIPANMNTVLAELAQHVAQEKRENFYTCMTCAITAALKPQFRKQSSPVLPPITPHSSWTIIEPKEYINPPSHPHEIWKALYDNVARELCNMDLDRIFPLFDSLLFPRFDQSKFDANYPKIYKHSSSVDFSDCEPPRKRLHDESSPQTPERDEGLQLPLGTPSFPENDNKNEEFVPARPLSAESIDANKLVSVKRTSRPVLRDAKNRIFAFLMECTIPIPKESQEKKIPGSKLHQAYSTWYLEKYNDRDVFYVKIPKFFGPVEEFLNEKNAGARIMIRNLVHFSGIGLNLDSSGRLLVNQGIKALNLLSDSKGK